MGRIFASKAFCNVCAMRHALDGTVAGVKNGRRRSFFEQNRLPWILAIPKYRLTPLLPTQIRRWNAKTRLDIAFQSHQIHSCDAESRFRRLNCLITTLSPRFFQGDLRQVLTLSAPVAR